jgi:hypothetical protein
MRSACPIDENQSALRGPSKCDFGQRVIATWPLKAALGAAPVPEVSQQNLVIDKLSTAGSAVAGVGGVGKGTDPAASIVNPEPDDRRGIDAFGEARDGWVVGTEQNPRSRGHKIGEARSPSVENRIKLAVAVELVAEEIAEEKQPRAYLAADLRDPKLVSFEQPDRVLLGPAV